MSTVTDAAGVADAQSQAEAWMLDHRIDEVEAVIPDMAGVPRGKFFPARKFLRQPLRLPESVFLQGITGDYGEVLGDLYDIDPDLHLQPDYTTLRLVPWTNEPTASVIVDCYRRNSEPLNHAPRQVLKRILDLYSERGWKPVIAPEVEFYLVKRNTDPDYPLEAPVGRAGRKETAGRMYSIESVNEFDPIIEDIYDYCEVMEIDADSLSHEDGAGQLEVNFLHGDPLELADQVFLFKRVAREAAFKHGIYATFMAKPMEGQPGSALHLHQSVVDAKTGENLFSEADGSISSLFRSFIGGLQKYVPQALILFGPYVNSYRRFTRYLAAPINVQWGYDNRTVGLRVPDSDPANRRVENRIPGADVNPYLAIAASLACGYMGMAEQLTPTEPLSSSAYRLEQGLARDLFAALDMMEACAPLHEIFGPSFIEIFCAIKRVEHENFFEVISPWEREHLLLNV
jgi:glutamine synthetase